MYLTISPFTIDNYPFTILLNPICNKTICIPRSTIVSVAAKHWECIKTFVPGNLLNVICILICNVHIKRETSFALVITAKKKMLSARRKVGCPVCLFKIGNLVRIISIRISNLNLHVRWRNKVFSNQFFVFFYFISSSWSAGTPNNFSTIRAKPCATIIS